MHRSVFNYLSLFAVLCCNSLIADVFVPTAQTTEWRFNGDYSAVYGPGVMTAQGAASSTDTFTSANIGGQTTNVLDFSDRASNADGYTVNVNIDGSLDGGASDGVDQFTMIFDIAFTDATRSYMGLWNGNASNSNDSELFIRPDTGGFWMPTTGSVAGGTLTLGQFHRVVFRNDWINNDVDIFVDGTLVVENAGSPDYVFDGSSNPFWFLTDNTPGETASGRIAAFAFANTLLSDQQIIDLGSSNANGIFSAVPEPSSLLSLMTIAGVFAFRRKR